MNAAQAPVHMHGLCVRLVPSQLRTEESSSPIGKYFQGLLLAALPPSHPLPIIIIITLPARGYTRPDCARKNVISHKYGRKLNVRGPRATVC